MKTIYKLPIQITDQQTLILPEGFEILTVQTQKGDPYIWVKVDTSQPDANVDIYVYGTGHQVTDETAVYLGTFQQLGGESVWHVFWNYKS